MSCSHLVERTSGYGSLTYKGTLKDVKTVLLYLAYSLKD